MLNFNDKTLIAQGKLNLELAERNMGALMRLRERFKKEKTFKGVRIGMALHITKETGVLVRTLIDAGAEVAITSCNPLSAQNDVIAALKKEGIAAYGYKGESHKEYYKFLKQVLALKPHITIDDGCDLVTELHENYPPLLKTVIGGCEETTTGVIRLKAMAQAKALKYPVIAVNDNKTKHLMDNYYGTGQSTLDGIIRASNILFAGKTVVIAGYGDCGKGVAMRAKGMGANVLVTEIDAFCALQARMDGFQVMPMSEAAKIGDIFVTVTGNIDVLRPEHFKVMKDGAMMANSGHFDVEIDLKSLEKIALKKRTVRPYLDEYELSAGRGAKKALFVVGEGRLANLAAAEGHPSEVMSMSFCGQALAAEYLLKNKDHLKAGVYTLPDEIDATIASLQLQVLGIKTDKLSERQKKYLASWKEGT
jgi:adenosylhomocysteinase